MSRESWRRNCTFTKSAGNAVVHVQRELRSGENGAMWLNQRVEVDGEFSDHLVTGPTAILEYIQIKRGSLCIGNSQKQGSVALLLPAFSVTPVRYANVATEAVAILFKPGAQKQNERTAVLFETNGHQMPPDARTLLQLLASTKSLPADIPVAPSTLSLSAKKMLDENYKDRPSIAKIASALGVSHSHLARRFKSDFGMAPMEYCHRLRVAAATWMLSSGEKILKVSMDVGYEDLSRFYKQFRKITSHSPGFCKEETSRKGATPAA